MIWWQYPQGAIEEKEYLNYVGSSIPVKNQKLMTEEELKKSHKKLMEKIHGVIYNHSNN